MKMSYGNFIIKPVLLGVMICFLTMVISIVCVQKIENGFIQEENVKVMDNINHLSNLIDDEIKNKKSKIVYD